MSVLHVVASGEIGGAERMLIDLAQDGTRTHAIALFTPNERLRGLFREARIDVDDRGPVREGPLSFLASALGPRDVGWLQRTLERRRAKIVHLHTFASQVLGTRAALRAGVRIVRTEHSTRVYDDPTCWPFSRWSLARADAVVCVSDHVRRVAERRAGLLRAASVVHNGVDVERFRPANTDRREDAPIRFVALGRLDPRKGLDVAIEALAAVPRAELEIVGEGSARTELEEIARRSGVEERVRFTGYVDDVREAIARADVALSSARSEGLGIALLEAMAMGIPVVGLPVGGVIEIVDSGGTGWLARGRKANDLAAVMRQATDDPAELRRRGARARDRVVARFSLAAMRAGYERIYSRFD